jgi:hypothetical protein
MTPPADFGSLPPNPEYVPGTPEFEAKRRRLRDEVRTRTGRGESRAEVEDWLIREGLDPGDATRLVDAVVRPPANRLRPTPPDKPVTDPEFAFAAAAAPADHVRAKVARSWYLFRAVGFATVVLAAGFVVFLAVKLFAG